MWQWFSFTKWITKEYFNVFCSRLNLAHCGALYYRPSCDALLHNRPKLIRLASDWLEDNERSKVGGDGLWSLCGLPAIHNNLYSSVQTVISSSLYLEVERLCWLVACANRRLVVKLHLKQASSEIGELLITFGCRHDWCGLSLIYRPDWLNSRYLAFWDYRVGGKPGLLCQMINRSVLIPPCVSS